MNAKATAIPFALAMLCLDCAHVVALSRACSRCGSREISSLSRWLNREED